MLIRYMSDISFPLDGIKVAQEYNPQNYTITINGKYGFKGVSERPAPTEYVNMPLFLSSLNTDNLCKWVNAWGKISQAIITFDMAKEKPLHPRMVNYIKAFDTLSSYFDVQTANIPKDEFKKWKNEEVENIMKNNIFDFPRARIDNLFNNLIWPELSTRITTLLEANKEKINEIKEKEDIPQIARYLKHVRVADAHPSKFDIFNIPEGYTIFDMCNIAKKIVRILIDKEFFSSC